MLKLRNFIVIVVIFSVFLTLLACNENKIITHSLDKQLEQKIIDEEKCANVACGTNQRCRTGNCVCVENFKECESSCIPVAKCCNDSDCDEGKFCDKDSKCSKVPLICKYNEFWNSENETCECVEGTRFCDAQNKCMPTKNCCTTLDCTLRRDICVPTNYAASICIIDPQLHCKTIIEGNKAIFSIKTAGSFVINLGALLEKGSSQVSINGQNKTLMLNEKDKLNDNATLFVEHIKVLGGTCKLFRD